MTFWEVLKISYFDQKQMFPSILVKSYFGKFQNFKIHRRIFVLKSLFNTQNSMKSTRTLLKKINFIKKGYFKLNINFIEKRF